MFNVVTTPAPLFMIESSSFLQVTRTTIKFTCKSSKFGQIRAWTTELAAFECLEKWDKFCYDSSAFTFEWIPFILARNKDNHESLNKFEFSPDSTTDYRVRNLREVVVQLLAF